MKVILDTNFILTSIENKIDFIDEIEMMGHTPLVPKQVIDEMKAIHGGNKKLKFRDEAEIGLKILNKKKPSLIDIKERYVDLGIIEYTQDHPDVIVATLDRKLKEKLKTRIMTIRRAKKQFEIIR